MMRPAAARRLDVLVADDDPDACDALRRAVTALGHDCRVAASGFTALDAHRSRPADVIVSDWHMPELDGMGLCRRVRELDRGTYTYLLFTSASANKRDFVEAVRAGADDYLPKPIDMDDLEARLIAASRVVGAYRELAACNVDLRRDGVMLFRSARIDPLTGVANRLSLEEDLDTLQARVSRYGGRAAIAMCDLDSFKRYNDHYGHLAGDDALRRIAQAIRTNVRRADQVYRYGGEEFLVVLHEQGRNEAAAAMRRVCAAVESLAIAHAAEARRPVLTVSVGLASVLPEGHHAVREAIARADQALYRAKAEGGNTLAIDSLG
jgi:diguanylate cyclase (GGDEF)-like protein